MQSCTIGSDAAQRPSSVPRRPVRHRPGDLFGRVPGSPCARRRPTGTANIAHILIVDDEPPVLSVLTDLVKELGHEVASASTGAEGIAMARARTPDLILLDLVLSDLPGQVVLRRLLEAHPHVPVIMLTGTLEDFRDRARELGAFAFAEKPINFKELAQLIESALERTRG